MAKDTVRSGQLITTFGPGSMVDLPDSAVIISGLDHWEYNKAVAIPLVEEPRLLKALRKQFLEMDPPLLPPLHLRRPPPSEDRDTKKFSPHVTAWEFPGWFVVQRTETISNGGKRRRLVPKHLLEKGRFRDDSGKRQPVVPVRFVQSCNKGHVDDIDWISFVHPDAEAPCTYPLWMEERGTSGTLADTWIVCGCGKERSMSQAARRKLDSLGFCRGRRPWLGAASGESCGQPGRLLIRSASNAYFPQVLSVISIPDSGGELVTLVGNLWNKGLNIVGTGVSLQIARMIPEIGASLQPHSDSQVMDAIAKFQGAGAIDKGPKLAEFEAFVSTQTESGADVPDGDFYARILPESSWKTGKPWMSAFSKIVLVHRLREVVAQVGFTRFEAKVPELSGELDMEVRPQVLSKSADWLPAMENRGEGIFLQFDSDAIHDWLACAPVKDRAAILAQGFEDKLNAGNGKARPFHGAPFYMIHSFSHLLMTRIALDCGYPSGSIRERIYAEDGDYGILIYTGTPDAEGTLGGLVQAGRKISDIIRRALCFAELCSNDPVCASQKPNTELQRELLGAACHGCLLIGETSCEHRNCFLDRELVVKTMENKGTEFFKSYGI